MSPSLAIYPPLYGPRLTSILDQFLGGAGQGSGPASVPSDKRLSTIKPASIGGALGVSYSAVGQHLLLKTVTCDYRLASSPLPRSTGVFGVYCVLRTFVPVIICGVHQLPHSRDFHYCPEAPTSMHELTMEHAQSIVQTVDPGYKLVSVRPTLGSFTKDARILECRTRAGTLVRLVVKFLIDEPEEANRCAIAGFHALGLAQAHGVPVPEPIFLDEMGDVLGVPGIVTRFVEGRQVWNPRDPALWAEGFARLLLRIHAIRPDDQHHKYLFNGHDEGLHMLRDEWSKRKDGHPLSARDPGRSSGAPADHRSRAFGAHSTWTIGMETFCGMRTECPPYWTGTSPPMAIRP